MSSPVISVIFLFFALIIGGLLTFLIDRFDILKSIPYAILIFIIGIVMALVATQLEYTGDALVLSILQWAYIDPHLLLYTFLPVLLFGDGMTLNVHELRKALFPSILLALPGAVYSAYLTAVVCYYFFPYNWSWIFCFLIGSILCATDPVSVIALLQSESNSSITITSLTYVMIGEAFFNDTSALMLFEVVSQKDISSETTKNSSPMVSYTVEFIKTIFISPAIGFLIGILGVLCLRALDRRISKDDAIVQLVISICAAYVSFFLAQYTLEVSGVISCFVASIAFAWYGVPLYIQPVSVDTIRTTLNWCGNTLIFMIAGLLVGREVIQYVQVSDIANIIILYLMLQVIRLSLLVICYPIIAYMQPRFSFKNSLFAAFSGLRGAISLSLVVILESHTTSNTDPSILTFPPQDVHRAMFIICGVVTLTIVVNGTLARKVLIWLKITHESSSIDEQIIVHYLQKRIKAILFTVVRNLIDHLPQSNLRLLKEMVSTIKKQEFSFHYPIETETKSIDDIQGDELKFEEHKLHENSSRKNDDIQVLDSSIDLDAYVNTELEMKRKFSEKVISTPSRDFSTPANVAHHHLVSAFPNIYAPDSPNSNKKLSAAIAKLSLYNGIQRDLNADVEPELMSKCRNVFLDVVRRSYLKQISTGRLPRGSNAALLLLSSINFGLESTDEGLRDWQALLIDLNRIKYFIDLVRSVLEFSWIQSIYVLKNFFIWKIDNYEEDIILLLSSYIEGQEYAQLKLPSYLGEYDFVDTPEELALIAESISNVNEAKELLKTMNPSILSFHVTIQAARILLHTQEDVILHFVEEGILSVKEAEKLLEIPRSDLMKLHRFRSSIYVENEYKAEDENL